MISDADIEKAALACARESGMPDDSQANALQAAWRSTDVLRNRRFLNTSLSCV